MSYGLRGVELPTTNSLKQELRRIESAPLKPHQKFTLLSKYLLPRYFYLLQNPNSTRDLLKNFDKLARLSAKRILHLPICTTSSYLYASLRDGGLGITRLLSSIPTILTKRLANLRNADDPFIAAALHSEVGMNLNRRLSGMCESCGGSKDAIRRRLALELDTSYSGNGLHQGSCNKHSSAWINTPPSFWSGRDYVNAILLRGNMLPTVGVPSNPPEARRCRAGCFKTESLSHVLQTCAATHWSIIHRHDHLVQKLAKSAAPLGWSTLIEPHFRTSNGLLRKPDLLFEKGSEIIISDVAVSWEGPRPLTYTWTRKFDYYTEATFTEALRRRYPNSIITVLPFVLGARGTWCFRNDELFTKLGISDRIKSDLVISCIKGSCLIHRHFSTSVHFRH